jgi:hypothetical protein
MEYRIHDTLFYDVLAPAESIDFAPERKGAGSPRPSRSKWAATAQARAVKLRLTEQDRFDP